MEIKVNLQVSAEEFFDIISESIVAEIHAATGKNVRAKNLKKGFSYTRKLSKRRSYQVTITDYRYPLCYSAKIESVGGVNTLSYRIEPAADDTIDVIYEEHVMDLNGGNKEKGLNSAWAKVKGTRKIKNQLKSIEQFILSNRDEGDADEETAEENAAHTDTHTEDTNAE